MRDAGHEVFVGHDGADALAALERFRPSVAVIDLGMPVMDGYELAARIRAHPQGQATYLVALTGYGQPADRARTGAAGFDEHLVKPVDLEHLLQILARAASREVPAEEAARSPESAVPVVRPP